MKFNVASKDLIDQINAVTKTTGSETVNFENAKGFLKLKSSNKGNIHHVTTGIQFDEIEKGEFATVPVIQLTGMLNRRGVVDVTIDESSLVIKNKSFAGTVIIPPATEVDDIKSSDKTLELTPFVVSELVRHLPGLSLSNLYSKNPAMVQLECIDSEVKLCILDNAHIAYYKFIAEGQGNFNFELSRDDLGSLLDVIEENPSADFAVEESRVYVKTETTTLSYPKQQPGKLLPFKSLDGLVRQVLKEGGQEKLSEISVDLLRQEVDSCRHIASDQTLIELSASKSTYRLQYNTKLGSLATKGACKTTWNKESRFLVDPILFLDFLESIMQEEVELVYTPDSDRLYSYFEDDGYMSLHICMGSGKNTNKD